MHCTLCTAAQDGQDQDHFNLPFPGYMRMKCTLVHQFHRYTLLILAQHTAYTTIVLVHMPGGNGIGAHHTGGIELRHCDVSPGKVVWERIPEGPLRHCTLHATLVTSLHNQLCVHTVHARVRM